MPPGQAAPANVTELHRYAQALIVQLTADGTAPEPPPGVTDVPDHWLAPAVAALVRIMAGEDAHEAVERASRLDAERTALFLCLALAVCGLGDRVHASWLGTAFGELAADRPVTPGQRALWLAAARGAYGPVGKIFVLRKLDATAVPAEDERWLKALVPAEPEVTAPPSLDGFSELADLPEIARSLKAAATLRRLRERCAEIVATPATGEVTKVVQGTIWAEDEPLAVLRSLIGQEDREPPLGSLTELLLRDIRPGGDPHLAALALHIGAPAVKASAEALLEVVRRPPPDSVTVSLLGHPVTLRPEGPDQESLAAAEQRIAAERLSGRPRPWGAYALFGVAAVLVVLGLLLFPPLAVAGLGAAGGAGYLLWRHRVAEGQEMRQVQKRISELSDLADKAVWALHEYARELEARAEAAAEDVAELTRMLRRGPRAA